MKVLGFLLLAVPLAMAAPERRTNPFLSAILNVFHADEVKTIVTDLYHSMGTAEREAECESECNKLVDGQFQSGSLNTLGHTACPLICHSYQELVHYFDITPTTAPAAPAKRALSLNPFLSSILNVFHADEVKTIVTDLYHSMGSDEREVECESECSKLIETQFQTGAINTLGHTACPLICHSFQELVKHFDITPQTAVAPAAGTSAKRSFGSSLILNSILNVFHADEVKTIVTDLYHSMGTDEREAECEKECSNLIETQFHAGTLNTLGHTACPLICHSFQELVKHFDITPQTAVAPAAGTSAKRSFSSNLIINSILNVFHADEIKTIVTDLYHSMGTDEREAECEKECSNLIETQFHAGTLNTLGHTACPLICHSFQELVHHFDIAPMTAAPAPAVSAKTRSLNPIVNAVLNIFHVDEIKTIVTDLYSSMGSDEREAECEKECNNLVDTQFSTGTSNTLGHTACPLVCHSFQELVAHFNLSPATAPASGMTPA